jgi:DNA-binding transcriptional MerR regulator
MIKTYTIKEVAEDFDLSISTIRYYDKKGLLPFVAKNDAGYRIFTDADLNLIKTIVCLKNTGMAIKDIRSYIEDVMQGPSSIEHRKTLLKKHKREVLQKQQMLTENLKEIDFKLDRYNSPKAEEIVGAEFQYLTNEKKTINTKNTED